MRPQPREKGLTEVQRAALIEINAKSHVGIFLQETVRGFHEILKMLVILKKKT